MFGSRSQLHHVPAKRQFGAGQRQWQPRPACPDLEDVELFIQAMHHLEQDVAGKEVQLRASEAQLAESKIEADKAKRRAVHMSGLLCEAQAGVTAQEESLAVLQERQESMGAELARLNKRCHELMKRLNMERSQFVETMEGKTAQLQRSSAILAGMEK